MRTEYFELIGSDGTALQAVLWQPETPRAVLQIVHGMTEHMGRYRDFAAALAEKGIAVAGFDLRGHGKNPGDPEVASFGEGGWMASIDDMQLFHFHLEQLFPGVPQFMLGFSLGSFLLRDYLNIHGSHGLAGAVIMGTGHQPGWLLSVVMEVVAGQIKKVGFNQTSDLIRQLSFGTYNQRFKPNRTTADWLCSDPVALDEYLADPLVRKDISAGLFWELLRSMRRRGEKTEYDRWDKDFPILLLSGQQDPVGDGGQGVKAIHRQMLKSGMRQAQLHLIPGARHDLLHEAAPNGEEARDRILAWLDRR